jgi:hypothetical protein
MPRHFPVFVAPRPSAAPEPKNRDLPGPQPGTIKRSEADDLNFSDEIDRMAAESELAAATEPKPEVPESASPKQNRRRPGPQPGTINRYEKDDREYYPEIDRMVAEGKSSVEEAARSFGDKLPGAGDPVNKGKRLARSYRKERGI